MADDVGENERTNGFQRCKEFLGGAWRLATIDQFNMEYIRGGLSNLLYCCWLSDDVPVVGTEPRRVLLRIYGQIIHEHPVTVLTDSVIYALLAEKGMGPKLYGVFTTGRIEEYVPSRHLFTHELRDPKISAACAKVMAQFHQLTMPFVKDPRWLFDTMTRYLDEALNNVSFDDNPGQQVKLEKLLSYDLASELQSLRNMLSMVHSPVVFCHNDLQEGNILYVEDESGWHVRPIDFEYCSYSYRGFDIGNHFCEWCYCYDNCDFPYFTASLEEYPSRDQQLTFIRAYLGVNSTSKGLMNGGGKALDGGDCVEDVSVTEEAILFEADAYALASHFLWAVWSIVQSRISTIQFAYLDYALVRFEAYFKQKKDVVEKLPNGFTPL